MRSPHRPPVRSPRDLPAGAQVGWFSNLSCACAALLTLVACTEPVPTAADFTKGNTRVDATAADAAPADAVDTVATAADVLGDGADAEVALSDANGPDSAKGEVSDASGEDAGDSAGPDSAKDELSDASANDTDAGDGAGPDSAKDELSDASANDTDAGDGAGPDSAKDEVSDASADDTDAGDGAGPDSAKDELSDASGSETANGSETSTADCASADSACLVPAMLHIKAGKFLMGCVPGDSHCGPDEWPQHEVNLDAFDIDAREVTVAAYAACVTSGTCAPAGTGQMYCNWGKPAKHNHPINCVNWTQADSYCKWIGARLPTEAEWEMAARGGVSDTLYPWGNEQPTCISEHPNQAVFDPISGGTLQTGCGTFSTFEVGSGSQANGLGLYDVIGNVWEFVADPYDANFYASSPKNNPKGGLGPGRTCRGGSMVNSAGGQYVLRLSNRVPLDLESKDHGLSRRCQVFPIAN